MRNVSLCLKPAMTPRCHLIFVAVIAVIRSTENAVKYAVRLSVRFLGLLGRVNALKQTLHEVRQLLFEPVGPQLSKQLFRRHP